jgi:hypothetical protein
MNSKSQLKHEAARDLFFGQVVLVWARWLLIITAAVLALWLAQNALEMVSVIVVVVLLMALNFYLHARYLLEKPANRLLLLCATLLDTLLIAGLMATWRGPGGLDNPLFVLYYPLLFAFALVFPPRAAVVYTALVVAGYAAFGLIASPETALTLSGLQTLSTRLISLAAMGGLGAYYYRTVRAQRLPAA